MIAPKKATWICWQFSNLYRTYIDMKILQWRGKVVSDSTFDCPALIQLRYPSLGVTNPNCRTTQTELNTHGLFGAVCS